MLANMAGYIWNLYTRIQWFDEILHAFTSFALTLPLALWLYGTVLHGAHSRPLLFVLAVASQGIAVGTLWELVEWAYDEMVPRNAILGKTDTMIDLIADLIGSVLAGILSLVIIREN
jgi:hypothetical protein